MDGGAEPPRAMAESTSSPKDVLPPARGPARQSREGSSDFRMCRWSLRFQSPMVEAAYIKSKHKSMLLSLSRTFFILALALAFSWVSFLLHSCCGWFGGCVDVKGAASVTPSEELQSRTFVFVLAIICFVGFRLPRAKDYVSFRGGEAFICIVGIMLLLLPARYMRPEAHDGEWLDCFYFSFANAQVALAMDATITVIHLLIPIRWCIIIWLDVVYAAFFAVHNFSLLQNEGDLNTLATFIGLVIGAAAGLRSIEQSARLMFLSVIDERTLRTQAEFAARSQDTKVPRSHSEDDSETHASVPTTTATGAVFAELKSELSPSSLTMLLEVCHQGKWLLQQSEVEISADKVLGQGSFGRVVEGQFCGASVAIKTATKAAVGQLDLTSVNELSILRHVRHPNIVIFHGVLVNEQRGDMSLVFEKVDGITFATYVSQMLSWKEVAASNVAQGRVMRGVCSALLYLHTRTPCIVHGDVKPGNILIEQRRKWPFPKLLDFGLSRVVTRHARQVQGGSVGYVAPEVLRGVVGRANPAIDAFGFGRLMFYTACGRHPCAASDGSIQNWQPSLRLLERWRPTIVSLTDNGPALRPSMREVSETLAYQFPDDGEKINWCYAID